MEFKNLISDNDAVSPVIGVILMVAITVILAAVIGTFVLGLGDQVSDTSPTASFTFDFNDASPEELTITHDGGDTIDAAQLTIVATSATFTGPSGITETSSATWEELSSDSDFEVSAGSSLTIEDGDDALNGDTIRVTWQSSNGGDTATLGKWTGPGA